MSKVMLSVVSYFEENSKYFLCPFSLAAKRFVEAENTEYTNHDDVTGEEKGKNKKVNREICFRREILT